MPIIPRRREFIGEVSSSGPMVRHTARPMPLIFRGCSVTIRSAFHAGPCVGIYAGTANESEVRLVVTLMDNGEKQIWLCDAKLSVGV